MFTKSRLLSAVSGLALGTAASAVALANVPTNLPSTEPAAPQASLRGSSPLAEFLSRIGGQATAESVDRAIRTMYLELTREQADTLPDLLLEIRSLSLGKQIETAALEAMGALIVESPHLAHDPEYQMGLAAVLGSRMNGPVLPVRVAQAAPADPIEDDLCIYDPTDPNYLLDPDCPPLATQAIVPPTTTGAVPTGYTP